MEGSSLLNDYHIPPRVWDEMFSGKGIRPAYRNMVAAIQDLSASEMTHKDELAKKLFMSHPPLADRIAALKKSSSI